ncbi:MAG: helix-turn-helix transcriptional regulator [Chlorobi bacterium]|nr:helix-turn-helix transcriptional regulator [Chlorobiota bacterium]
MTRISSFLKYHRKRLNLTQEELANKAGVGIRFIREMEQGKQTLQLNKVNQVLSLFGYSLFPSKIKLDPYEIALNLKNDIRFKYFNKAVKITLKNRMKKYGFIINEIIDFNNEISGWKFVSNNNAIKYQKNRDDKLIEIISHSDIQDIEEQ